ncbi:hypothetical protein LguiA_002836 [Lonicera macranthoides]
MKHYSVAISLIRRLDLLGSNCFCNLNRIDFGSSLLGEIIKGLCVDVKFIRAWKEATRLLNEMVDRNISLDVQTFNVLIDKLCKEVMVKEAHEVLDLMIQRGWDLLRLDGLVVLVGTLDPFGSILNDITTHLELLITAKARGYTLPQTPFKSFSVSYSGGRSEPINRLHASCSLPTEPNAMVNLCLPQSSDHSHSGTYQDSAPVSTASTLPISAPTAPNAEAEWRFERLQRDKLRDGGRLLHNYVK